MGHFLCCPDRLFHRSKQIGIVELLRLQFAFTAMVHLLFVPLTLGLAFILAIMESVYVMPARPFIAT